MPSPEGVQYHIVETGVFNEFLGPEQNIADQAPFMDIPTLLPGLLRYPIEPQGVALLVRLSRRGVDAERAMYSGDYGALKGYLAGEMHSGVKLAVDTLHELMDEVPYLNDYLDKYWMTHVKLFSKEGVRLEENSEVDIPTFASFQWQYIQEHNREILEGMDELNLRNTRSKWYIRQYPSNL
jgi:hypothetical protein